jgi:hypothetical protein
VGCSQKIKPAVIAVATVVRTRTFLWARAHKNVLTEMAAAI